jgi:hypothetical protein
VLVRVVDRGAAESIRHVRAAEASRVSPTIAVRGPCATQLGAVVAVEVGAKSAERVTAAGGLPRFVSLRGWVKYR